MTLPREKHFAAAAPGEIAARSVPRGFDALRAAFSTLYGQTQGSDHVFGSPLGPFRHAGHSYWLPRFVYFGPQFSEASVRLAFYAGIDGSDDRPTRALLRFIERLVLKPDLGQGLNLAFFPLVNPSGLETGSRVNRSGADLTRAHWNLSPEPEIALVSGDARVRAYHGFVRIEAAPVVQLAGVVRSGSRAFSRPDSVLVPPPTDADGRFPVRWVVDDGRNAPVAGPLTLADDLANGPFELTLLVPSVWNAAFFEEAVLQVLRRFIVHYRASYAYGIHL